MGFSIFRGGFGADVCVFRVCVGWQGCYQCCFTEQSSSELRRGWGRPAVQGKQIVFSSLCLPATYSCYLSITQALLYIDRRTNPREGYSRLTLLLASLPPPFLPTWADSFLLSFPKRSDLQMQRNCRASLPLASVGWVLCCVWIQPATHRRRIRMDGMGWDGVATACDRGAPAPDPAGRKGKENKK